jgi:quercetin dioxygenase-like cupin family protein
MVVLEETSMVTPVTSARVWTRSEHLQELSEGKWLPMRDDRNTILPGIEGKHGARISRGDGTVFGADLIRMQPGTAFPLHVHEGDHEIIFLSGRGFVHINGEDIPVHAYSNIAIPGEYPHGVKTDPMSNEPLIFFAVGYPHKRVDSADRMRIVE